MRSAPRASLLTGPPPPWSLSLHQVSGAPRTLPWRMVLMRQMDPQCVYDKGVRARADLDEFELMVYGIRELETHNALEGWDAFFLGSCADLYPIVRDALTRIGDSSSLLILDDYQRYLQAHGVPVEPGAIARFVVQPDAAPESSALNWGDLFARAAPERWELMRTYLESHGIELLSDTERLPTRPSLAEALASATGSFEGGAERFVQRVLRRGVAWSVEIADGLKCRLSQQGRGRRVLLLWSSERSARSAAAAESSKSKLRRVFLDELLTSWLPAMSREGLLVGPDPDGDRQGFELGPLDLRIKLLGQMDAETRARYEGR